MLKAVQPVRLAQRALRASTLQYGRCASCPHPGRRSQCPPAGPDDVCGAHAPAQFERLCSCHASGAGLGAGPGDGGAATGTAQSTHVNVTSVALAPDTAVDAHCASVEPIVAAPVPQPTNDALHTGCAFHSAAGTITLAPPGRCSAVIKPKFDAVAPNVALSRASLSVYDDGAPYGWTRVHASIPRGKLCSTRHQNRSSRFLGP